MSHNQTSEKVHEQKKVRIDPRCISIGTVIDNLGFSTEEAAGIKLKVSLHEEILRGVKNRELKA